MSARSPFPVAPVADIPPGSRRLVHVPGVGPVGVFNLGGEYYALKNVCPHQGGPLCQGRLTGTAEPVFRNGEAPQLRWVRDGEILRCPWHAWEFDIRTGQAIFDGRTRVATYPVERQEPVAQAETIPTEIREEMVVLLVPKRA
jgi:nitrite reductase/ring-hydroxylating ferredoxin subunit